VRPGKSWDLRACTQKSGESLRDFIRHFSKRCTELPNVAQFEIVHAFLEGTTCWDLVRELGRSPPDDSNELFDIATSFASGEEAVGTIFDGKKGKRMDDAPAEGNKSKDPQQKHKQGKKGKKPRREAREQGHDDDGDEALAVDLARRGPRPAPRGPGVFDDMLKKPCPYHKTLVNHTLEQCDMLKRYYGNARFSKVLMDGGSSLNILYTHTLRLLGIGLDQLRPSTTPFHGVAPGRRVQPLGQIDLPVWFGTPDNFRKETLPSRWWDSGARTTPSLGGRATPSSWRSPITPTSR
jgi:hypothetical protein